MLYRDLIQFEPIETVIQLRDADQQSAAAHLVKTYVVSDRMADQLTNLVIPQLQFDRPQDNRGVLVVGNYGTGKSHLMSVVSSVAEFSETAELISHEGVRSAAQLIAGRFKVVRVEIGSTTRGLRDLLLDELQVALERWETPYTFPPADQITNNKNDLIRAVAGFQQKYPDLGILLVIDELLDYLRSREQRALLLDLGFLRELGEVAASIPLRLLAGLQESLFDSPRFAFVTDELRRVRDRFEQVRIAREDIAFVVANRLLRKSDAQLATITEHLRQFTPRYRSMAERLDEFARLFPIHPAYIATFEQVEIAEKREVLKSFSLAIRALLDQDVPTDSPGLVSYDHYWGVIQENVSWRSVSQIAQVIEKSTVLEGRIRNAYTRPNLMDMALRIIAALSVHRLTTSDIFVPLGMTAEELRDGLCLHTRLPETTAEFLLDQVQVALREMMRTVQGQFLSYNEDNGQYYLDLKKVVDFDAKIAERGDFMERTDLSNYFFDALRLALNLSDTTYVTNYNIWFYELPWGDHKVTRPGYLFFGAPDDRSTAQPPRDFYVFWLPPFLNRAWHDEQRPDEVIFELANLDDEFEHQVRLYAGAQALANESAEYRSEYADKAGILFRKLSRWLNEHLTEHLYIVYQGVRQPVTVILGQLRSTASQTLDDLLHLVASHLLSPEFQDKYPDYPSFRRLSQPVSEAARENSVMEAIRAMAGRPRTALATAILDGLGLLEASTAGGAHVGDVVRPFNSPYARKFLELLERKAEGQVVNRGELIEQVSGGLQPIEKDIFFHLEPAWVVVVLISLVYSGDIVINVDGREELDASNLERAVTLNLEALGDFRFFKRPRTLPLSQWVAIFDGFGLPSGLIRDENTRPRAVEELQRTVNAELERAAALQDRLNQGLTLWNTPVFTDRFTMVVEGGSVVASDQPKLPLSVTQLLPGIRGYKQFLEEISRINTVGKLRNLRLTSGEVAQAQEHRAVTQRAQQLIDAVIQIQPISTYLVEAQANLPADHNWEIWASEEQQKTLDLVRKFGRGEDRLDLTALTQRLTQLKNGYISAYADLHRQLVLGQKADERRARLYSDARLKALEQLANIELINRGELDSWKKAIQSLPTCREFHEGLLADQPTCSCRLRPNQSSDSSAEQTLNALDNRLDDLLQRWRQALCTNLGSDTAQHSLRAMTPAERQPIEAFLAQEDTDTTIPAGFVASASQALYGIEAVTLSADDLLQALHEGGLPCTAEELQRRFSDYVHKTMRGHDARNTRLTLDQ